MPMFLSQTAIAWNSDLLSTPPASYDELVAWTQKHPQALAITASRTACPASALWWAGSTPTGTDAQRLSAGPYDKSVEKAGSRPMRS